MGQKIAPHNVEHLNEQGSAKRVEDLVFGFAMIDDALRAEDSQVLGNVGRLNLDLINYFADAEFIFAKGLDDVDSGGMGQGLKDVCFESSQRFEVPGWNKGLS